MSTYEPWRKSDAGACLDRAWQGARVGGRDEYESGRGKREGEVRGKGLVD